MVPDGQADLILCARRCYSLRPRRCAGDAVVVRGGRVIAVGRRRAVSRWKGRGTRVIRLDGGAITPGLVDCHTHFFYWALQRARAVDLSDCRTLDAALNKVRREGRRRSLGDWIVGYGFDSNTWPEGMPTASDLDRAVPDRPVLLHSRDGHSAWLNSVALRRAAITAQTPDPKGGRYLRDAHGHPNGIVQEAALDLLPDPVREFAQRTDAAALCAIDRALEDACRVAWSLGIVGVHDMDDAASLSHWQRQRRERRLGLRVVHAIPLARLPQALALGLRTGLGDDWLRIGGVKIFADGALGSQTAHMLQPYPGRGDYCGVPVIAGRELREAAVDAARHGWAVWVHAIGDRAVRDAVAALAAARRAERKAGGLRASPLPHRIEHVQCARPGDLRRMGRLGIVASVQPCHIMGDIRTAERHWPRAARYAYAFRSMLDAGVTLAVGSDVPVESPDPRRALLGAVVRTDDDGYPPGGWYPAQRIGVEHVLRGYTAGAAAAAGDAEPGGLLAPGVRADLTLWYDDPLLTPPEALGRVRIAGCVVGGRVHLNAAGGEGG